MLTGAATAAALEPGPSGKLVVVGGHSRRVGKSCMMRAILRATPEMNWHAVKISSHRHPGCRPSPSDAGADAAPAAGALHLLRLADSEFAAGITDLSAQLARGRNLLVESNRIVSHLAPDLVIFVIDPLNPDWKASSAACLHRAGALVFSQDGPCPPLLSQLPRMLPAFRLAAWNQAPLAFSDWIRQRLPAVETIAAAERFAHDTPSSLDSLARRGECCGAVSGPARGPSSSSQARGPARGRPQAHQVGQRDRAGFHPLPLRSLELV